MKEEEYRDLIVTGYVGGKKRLNLMEVMGLQDSYRANPSTGTGIGQMVFARYCAGGICMGMCVSGSQLTPWALRPVVCDSQSSGCGSTACVTNGFEIGTGTFVALGGGDGATVWRRIS
jgi:hypothetical protein